MTVTAGTGTPPDGSSTSEPLELEQPGALGSDLGWAIRRLSMSFQDLGALAVAHLPQGARGYLVLVAVAPGEASSQLDLVQRLGIDKTSMTRLIDALEDDGLVVRRPDRSDRRARRIEITPAGVDALRRARDRLEQIESDLLSPLSTAERTSFRAMVSRVAIRASARLAATE